MAYVPNATDITQPTSSQEVASAALEFRTLKSYLDTSLDALDASLQAEVDALEALQEESIRGHAGESLQRLTPANSRKGKLLAFHADTGQPHVTDFTASQVGDAIAAAYVGAPSSTAVAFIAEGEDAVPRTAQEKMRERISALDFGAVGDGATDDTAAVQAAIDACHQKELDFPSGHTFLCGPLTVSHTLSIHIEGVLKMKDASGVLLNVTADDVTIYGSGLVDLNNTQNKGIQISGQRPHVYGLTLANMLGGPATSGASSALNIANAAGVYGARIHDLIIRNIQKGTAPAPFVSQPRALSFDFMRESAVADVLCENTFCAAGIGAVSKCSFSNISVTDPPAIVDNGFYIINSSDCYFSDIAVQEWAGEVVVFSGCNRITFNGGYILDWSENAAFGFENSTNIVIDGMRLRSFTQTTVSKTRPANTSSANVTFRSMDITVGGGNSDIIASYNGVFNQFQFLGGTVRAYVDAVNGVNRRLIHLSNTDWFVISNNNFVLQESPGTASGTYFINLNASAPSLFSNNIFTNLTVNGRLSIAGAAGYVNFAGPLTPALFGARANGVADDADAIAAALAYADAQGAELHLGSSTYKVSSEQIFNCTNALRLASSGATILYDPSTATGTALTLRMRTGSNYIKGPLTLDVNSKAYVGLKVEPTNNATQEPDLLIQDLTVLNAYRSGTAFNDGDGILVVGKFRRVHLIRPTVKDCRLAAGAGVAGTYGIFGITFIRASPSSANYCPAYVVIEDPWIENIWSEDPAYYSDQDGIRVFTRYGGAATGGLNNPKTFDLRGGRVINVRGRSVKVQTEAGRIDGIKLYRTVTANSGSTGVLTVNADIECQTGGCTVSDVEFQYEGFAHMRVVRFTQANDTVLYPSTNVIHGLRGTVTGVPTAIDSVIMLSGNDGSTATTDMTTHISNVNVESDLTIFNRAVALGSTHSTVRLFVAACNISGKFGSSVFATTTVPASVEIQATNIINRGTAVALFSGAASARRITASNLLGVTGYATEYVGAGSPETVVTAVVGSTYRRTDGGAGTSFYVKESGTGNTGWVAK